MSIYDEIAKLKQKRQPARPKSEAQFQAERAEEKKLAHLMAMEIKDKAVIWAVSADDYKTGKLIVQGIYLGERFSGKRYLDMYIKIYRDELKYMDKKQFYTLTTSPQMYGTLKDELEKMGFKKVNINHRPGYSDYETFQVHLELDLLDWKK